MEFYAGAIAQTRMPRPGHLGRRGTGIRGYLQIFSIVYDNVRILRDVIAAILEEAIEDCQEIFRQVGNTLSGKCAFLYIILAEARSGIGGELIVRRPSLSLEALNYFSQSALTWIIQWLTCLCIGLYHLFLAVKAFWNLPIFFAGVHGPYLASARQFLWDTLVKLFCTLFRPVVACGYSLWNSPLTLGGALDGSGAKLGWLLQVFLARLTALLAPILAALDSALQGFPTSLAGLACISIPYLVIFGEFLWDLPINLTNVVIFLVGTFGHVILLGLVLFNVFLLVAVFKGVFPGDPLDHLGFAIAFVLSPVTTLARTIAYILEYLWLAAVRLAPSILMLLRATGKRIGKVSRRAVSGGIWCTWVGSALFAVTVLNILDLVGRCTWWPCVALYLTLRLAVALVWQIIVLLGRLVANIWGFAQAAFDRFVVFLARRQSHRGGFNQSYAGWLARQGGTWLVRIGWFLMFYVFVGTLSWTFYELH